MNGCITRSRRMNNHHQHVICTVKASYLEWYALVIRLVDIDRNRVAPLACHLAARVKTSHERLYTRSKSMNNKHQHVICTVQA